MPELMIDFITSLEGYGAADDWPGLWGMDVPEYLAWAERPGSSFVLTMVRPEELPRPDTATEKPMRESYYELHDFVKN